MKTVPQSSIFYKLMSDERMREEGNSASGQRGHFLSVSSCPPFCTAEAETGRDSVTVLLLLGDTSPGRKGPSVLLKLRLQPDQPAPAASRRPLPLRGHPGHQLTRTASEMRPTWTPSPRGPDSLSADETERLQRVNISSALGGELGGVTRQQTPGSGTG